MGDERGSIWAKTRTFWRAVFEKPSPKEKTGKQWPPLFSARLPLGAHSAALTASSSVRKLLPAAHGLPKNGLCKLIPEGEWQRVPVWGGAASAGAGAGAGHLPGAPASSSWRSTRFCLYLARPDLLMSVIFLLKKITYEIIFKTYLS